jgi:hypothetical protein
MKRNGKFLISFKEQRNCLLDAETYLSFFLDEIWLPSSISIQMKRRFY